MTTSQIYPLELLDETLDINATDNYDLSLELSEEGVSLAILDLLRGKYVMLRHYPREIPDDISLRPLNDIIEADDFLQRHYRKVFIIAPTMRYTMVPAPVYEPSLKDDYFRFNYSEAGENAIYSNKLPFPDAVVLFSPENEVTEALVSKMNEITVWHHTRPLLQHVSMACRSSDDRYIHLHFEKSFITVIIAENRNLNFCNSFPRTAITDAGYFLFSVLEARGIRNDETLHVSGIVEPYSEVHLSLLNFAENIKFASPVIRQSYSYVMNEVHLHRWLNLFTAASCE
jgi:hypothetical protein